MTARNREAVAGVIAEIFSTLLKREVAPGEAVNRETEAKWDSLVNVELVMSIEEELDCQFDPAALERITSMADFVDAVVADGDR